MGTLRLLLLSLLWLSFSTAQWVTFNPKIQKTNIPHLDTALTYVGIFELKPNRSPQIDMFNQFVGVPFGSSYCASYVSYSIAKGKATFPNFKSALAQGFIVKDRRYNITAQEAIVGSRKVPPGSIVVFKNGSTWKGHAALSLFWDKTKGTTVEGNTSPSNSGSIEAQRNGDGIYIKFRTIQPGSYFRITNFTEVRYGK